MMRMDADTEALRRIAAELEPGQVRKTLRRGADILGMAPDTLRRRLVEHGLVPPSGKGKVAGRFEEIVREKGGTLLGAPTAPYLACAVRCGACGHEWSPMPANVVYRGTWCPRCACASAAEKRSRKRIYNVGIRS